MRSSWFAIALVLCLTAIGACLIELDRAIACGDGHVDRLAGEECDPLDPSSFANACRDHHPTKHGGQAACDPVTCTFDLQACARCGDGQRDPGEECDGNDLGGQSCPIGLPGLRCTPDCRIDDSACPSCGNGVKDEDEECDYADVGGFVMPRRCAGSEGVPALDSPWPNYPYTYGETSTCEQDCRYRRLGCSYCGNGRRDDAVLIDDVRQLFSLPELCDGDSFNDAELMAQYGTFCYQMDDLQLRPNVGCAANCLEFVERSPAEPPCCRKKGERCPGPGDVIPCCAAYDFEDPCQTVFDSQGLAREVCR